MIRIDNIWTQAILESDEHSSGGCGQGEEQQHKLKKVAECVPPAEADVMVLADPVQASAQLSGICWKSGLRHGLHKGRL